MFTNLVYFMQPKLVIFDFDGVIVNTEDVFFHNLYNNLVKAGINMSFEKCCQFFAGHDTFTTLEKVVQQYNCKTSAEQIYDNISANKHNLLQQVEATAHVEEFILKLKNQLKIPYCIASNSGLDHIETTLKIVKLNKYFNKKIVFSGVNHGFKPAPDLYLHALKTMGFAAKDSIIIEDSPAGATAAIAAGVKTIGFLSNSHIDKSVQEKLLKDVGVITTVHSFKEIIDLIIK